MFEIFIAVAGGGIVSVAALVVACLTYHFVKVTLDTNRRINDTASFDYVYGRVTRIDERIAELESMINDRKEEPINEDR